MVHTYVVIGFGTPVERSRNGRVNVLKGEKIAKEKHGDLVYRRRRRYEGICGAIMLDSNSNSECVSRGFVGTGAEAGRGFKLKNETYGNESAAPSALPGDVLRGTLRARSHLT
jgi:hypothetical protein